jgi:hypothetical protein
MTDFTVPGTRDPDQLENVRWVSSRGKAEATLLIVLMGTAAAPVTTDIRATPRPDVIEQSRIIKAWKPPPLLSYLAAYPDDLVTGWDNFHGWPPPEADFIQPRTVPLVSTLTSYAAYDATKDVLQWRRKADWQTTPDFIQPWRVWPLQTLVPLPTPIGDQELTRRFTIDWQTQTVFDKPNRGAWHVTLRPDLDVPPTPILPVELIRFEHRSRSIRFEHT